MMKLLQLLSLLATLEHAKAYFPANESSYLNFLIPQSLHHNTTSYPHQAAHFGSHWSVFAKEGIMTHQVYYAQNDTFCGDYVPTGNDTHHDEKWQPPFFLMIDHGGCTFVTKVRNAQKRGALGVILVDNVQSPDLPILADDGSGHDVSIPSMMISRTDAREIKEVLKKKQPVVAEMAWHWPKHEKEAVIRYWDSVISTRSAEFLTNFSMIASKLEDRMKFVPHYMILDGEALHCQGEGKSPEDPCYDLCTNHGRYCSAGHHGVSGRKVVIEALRRMCITEHYGMQHWWDYLDHFTKFCMENHDDEYFANEDCLNDAFSHSAVDKDTIATCMKDSGDITSDGTNTMLSKSLERIREFGIFESPTILVNEAPIRWMPLSPKTVFDVYCAAFEYGKAPHACYACSSCGDPTKCIQRDPMQCHADDGKEQEEIPSKGDSKKKKGMKGRHWGFFFIFSSMAGAAGYVYYKRRLENGGDGFGAYSLADAFMSDSA